MAAILERRTLGILTEEPAHAVEQVREKPLPGFKPRDILETSAIVLDGDDRIPVTATVTTVRRGLIPHRKRVIEKPEHGRPAFTVHDVVSQLGKNDVGFRLTGTNAAGQEVDPFTVIVNGEMNDGVVRAHLPTGKTENRVLNPGDRVVSSYSQERSWGRPQQSRSIGERVKPSVVFRSPRR